MTETPDISKGKGGKNRKKAPRERIHYHVMLGTPPVETGAHAAARGYTESMNQAKPDVDKGAADMALSAEQRAARGNSANVPDFNRERASRNDQRVAVGAPDLKQQPPTVFSAILSRLHANPYSAVGQVGFGGPFSATDRPAQAPGDAVTVAGYDAAASCGSLTGLDGGDCLDSVDYRPQVRTEYHIAPTGSGTNGSHSLHGVESNAVANKFSDKLALMRETQRIVTG